MIGGILHLLLIKTSHGLSEGISGALNLLNGVGSTFNLVARLTGVVAPANHGLRLSLSHSLSESLGGTLNLGGDVGSTLHLVAGLTGVVTPANHSGGGGSRSGQNSKGNSKNLHVVERTEVSK